MKKEIISDIIGNLAERHIEEALNYEEKLFCKNRKSLSNAAACVAAIMIGILGTTAIAFAANKDFRNTIIQFVSGFSEEETGQINNGHMTMNLDKEDMLIEFLHGFDNKETDAKLKYDENGFEYIFQEDNANNIKAVVSCESEDVYLIVNIEKTEIEGVSAWKVKSYQFVSSAQVDEMLSDSAKKDIEVREESGDGQNGTETDGVIKATEKCGKIYNALHKGEKDIAELTAKETERVKSILEKYKKDDEEGWDGENYNYIILLDNQDFMMTSEGEMIKEEKGKTIGFKITDKDLKVIKELFHKYKIPE